MTEEYLPPSAPPPWPDEPLPPQEQGTADVVKDQAAELGRSGAKAGQHAVDVARDQAADVAAEAGRQGRNLLRQAQDELGEQTARGQRRLAAELISLGDQLGSMADGSPPGVASDLARQAASRARDAGQWLGDRRPAQVIDEVQAFARRRPGVFLALAAGAGLLAGRLTRGIQAASRDDQEPAAPTAPGAGPQARGPSVPQASGPSVPPPVEPAYFARAGDDVAAPAGLPTTARVTAADPDAAYGDGASLPDDQVGRLADDQVGRGDLR